MWWVSRAILAVWLLVYGAGARADVNDLRQQGPLPFTGQTVCLGPLSTCVSNAGSNITTLVISTPISYGSPVTVPSNVSIEIAGNGSIDFQNQAGTLLTIRGCFSVVKSPDVTQSVFRNYTSTSVAFSSNPCLQSLAPEWWGANNADSTADTTAFAAMAAAAGVIPMQLSVGTYLLTGSSTVPGITILSGGTLRGPGILKLANGQSQSVRVVGLETGGSGFAIENLTIDGNQANRSGGTADQGHCVVGFDIANVDIEEIQAQNCEGDGIYISTSSASPVRVPVNIRIRRNKVIDATRQGMTVDASDLQIANNYISGALNGCIHQEPWVALPSDIVDVQIIDNQCFDNGTVVGAGGIAVSGTVASGTTRAKRPRISGNFVRTPSAADDNSVKSYGISCANCVGAKIIENTLYYAGTAPAGMSGIRLTASGSVVPTDNEISHNTIDGYNVGISFADQNVNPSILWNTLRNIVGVGISYVADPATVNGRIVGNYVQTPSGNGIEIRGAGSLLLADNIVLDAGGTYGLRLYQLNSTNPADVSVRDNRAWWTTPTGKTGINVVSGATRINFYGDNQSNGAKPWDVAASNSTFEQSNKRGAFLIRNATGTYTAGMLMCVDTGTAQGVKQCTTSNVALDVVGVLSNEVGSGCTASAYCPVVTAGEVTVNCDSGAIGEYLKVSGTTNGRVVTDSAPTAGALRIRALSACSSNTLTALIGN